MAEGQLLQAKTLLEGVSREYAIQAEIRSIDHQIEGLQIRRSELMKEIQTLRSFPAPITSLPNDILGEIFEYIHHHESRSPITPMGVCSAWRDLIVSMPQLWTTLKILPHSIADCEPLFKRSGVHVPIEVMIGSKKQVFPRQNSIKWPGGYLSRIKTLTLLKNLPNIRLGKLKNLQTLQLRCGDWGKAEHMLFSRDTGYPQLRRLQIIHFNPPESIPHSLLAITHIELQKLLNDDSISHVYNFVSQLPSLLHLSIVDLRAEYDGSDLRVSLTPRVLPNLETLILAIHRHTSYFLRLLTLPKLTNFELTGAEGHFWMEHFEELASRSKFSPDKCTMRRCKPFLGDISHLPYQLVPWYSLYEEDFIIDPADALYDYDMHDEFVDEERDEQVAKLLTAAPSIRYLRVIDSVLLSDYVISPLFPPKANRPDTDQGKGHIGPNLRHLWIEHSKFDIAVCDIFDIDNILDMFMARFGLEGKVEIADDQRFTICRSGRPGALHAQRSFESLRAEYGPRSPTGISYHIFF